MSETDLEKELLRSQNREEIANRKLERLKARYRALQAAMERNLVDQETLQSLNSQLEVSEQRIQRLRQEAFIWKSDLNKGLGQLKHREGEVSELKERLRRAQSKVERLQSKAWQGERDRTELERALVATRSRLSWLEESREQDLRERAVQNQRLDNAREALEAARTQLLASRRRFLQLHAAIERLEQRNAELESSETMRERLQDELGQVRAELQRLKAAQSTMPIPPEIVSSAEYDAPSGPGILARAGRVVGSWLKMN